MTEDRIAVLRDELEATRARAEAAEKECEDHKRALAYQVAQFSDLMRRAEAAEAERAELRSWQADQLVLIDDTEKLIKEMMADKKTARAEALEDERLLLQSISDRWRTADLTTVGKVQCYIAQLEQALLSATGESFIEEALKDKQP